jgi:hypothetical protein
MFLGGIVRSERESRGASASSSMTNDETADEVKRLSLACLQGEEAEKRAQWQTSLALLKSSMQAQDASQRQTEIEARQQQFEQEMEALRAAHTAAADQNAIELVPYMLVARSIIATEQQLACFR